MPALLSGGDERAHHVAGLLRGQPGDERNPRAIDVPAGKVRVVTMALVSMHGAVEADVRAIDIAPGGWLQERDTARNRARLCRLAAFFDGDASRVAIPGGQRLAVDHIEVPAWKLSIEVCQRGLTADRGQANLHMQHRLARASKRSASHCQAPCACRIRLALAKHLGSERLIRAAM